MSRSEPGSTMGILTARTTNRHAGGVFDPPSRSV